MKAAALLVFVAIAVARLWLSWLNLRHLQREGHRVPPGLEGEVSAERLGEISDYTAARARFGLLHSVLSTLVMALFLFAGGLGWYDGVVTGLVGSFVGQSVLFVLGLMLAGALLEIPFSLYVTFRIEAKHGFNRQTPGLWWSDWVKSTLLSLVLTAALAPHLTEVEALVGRAGVRAAAMSRLPVHRTMEGQAKFLQLRRQALP